MVQAAVVAAMAVQAGAQPAAAAQPPADAALAPTLERLARAMDKTGRANVKKPYFRDSHRDYPQFRTNLLNYVRDCTQGLSQLNIVGILFFP